MKCSKVFLKLSVLSLSAIWLALVIGTHAHAQGVWETMPGGPPATANTTATAVIAGQLYAVSGSNTTVVQVYDPASNTWTNKAPIGYDRAEAVAGVIDGKLYVVGGVSVFRLSNWSHQYTGGV